MLSQDPSLLVGLVAVLNSLDADQMNYRIINIVIVGKQRERTIGKKLINVRSKDSIYRFAYCDNYFLYIMLKKSSIILEEKD